jgi:hypothetical protein
MAFAFFLTPLAVVTTIGFVLYQAILSFRFRATYKFPNLVPGLPVIGNILQIPKENQRLYFTKLAHQYGEM